MLFLNRFGGRLHRHTLVSSPPATKLWFWSFWCLLTSTSSLSSAFSIAPACISSLALRKVLPSCAPVLSAGIASVPSPSMNKNEKEKMANADHAPPPRRSTRKRHTIKASDAEESENGAGITAKKTPDAKVKGSKKATMNKQSKNPSVDKESAEDDAPTPKKGSKKTLSRKKTSGSENSDGEDSPPKKKAKSPAHQVLTERDAIPKLWNACDHKESYTFKIGSWNVAGLRACMKKDPDAIGNLIGRLGLDVLCIQETKLQESHLEDPKVELPVVNGYEAHYSCSTAKKGYSGTAVFIRKRGNDKKKGKQASMDAFVKLAKEAKKKASSDEESIPVDVKYLVPDAVTMRMGVEKHDSEGRIIVMDFPLFTACNLYVPNSGQKLERLEYRTKEWDKDMLSFMQRKQQERGVPVLWCGDLNVAHTHLEVWNDGAKHLPKQAGVTPEERSSFQGQLDAGFIDAFRKLHPDAKGHYSYWSNRAGNREPNKGLRLDYFICDPKFFDEDSQVVIRDSYMVHEQEGSDHCPVVLELEIKKDK